MKPATEAVEGKKMMMIEIPEMRLKRVLLR
jgi:hypothetical protein